MKLLIAFLALGSAVVFSGCEAYVVDHGPTYRRHAYHDDNYRPNRYEGRRVYAGRSGYYGHTGYNRSRVVYNDSPYYRSSSRVVYSTDSRGRYHVRNGRRVYVDIR